ncbi:hypothetical protein TNCV_4424371 [Trichonephila clavipes]|nr:hypothetical protein TNCV_4424371 [Trichonephila clavipes]
MACNAEDSGFQMLHDDEIMTSLHEESDPVDDKINEDEDNKNNESSKGPLDTDTFSALETAMECRDASFSPGTTEGLPYKELMPVKTIEAQNPQIGVVVKKFGWKDFCNTTIVLRYHESLDRRRNTCIFKVIFKELKKGYPNEEGGYFECKADDTVTIIDYREESYVNVDL